MSKIRKIHQYGITYIFLIRSLQEICNSFFISLQTIQENNQTNGLISTVMNKHNRIISFQGSPNKRDKKHLCVPAL